MKMFRARHREQSSWSHVRPAATFEQLEQRNLLSADLWHASTGHTPRQPFLAANYGNDSVALRRAVETNSAAWASAVDDVFENNDSFYQATAVGTINQPTTVHNLIMADRADWFQFRFNQAAGSAANVSLQFQNAEGDLDLAIYDSRGRLVGFSNGTADSETVALAGATAGTYTIFVYGYGGATNSRYSLSIDPGQRISDDRFEPNDSFAQAANLGVLTATRVEPGLAMADASDWYRFTMNGQGNGSSYVGVNFQHAAGDLDLEIYNSNGRRLGLSDGTTNSEVVSLAGLPSGTYYVRVYGYRGATNPNYSLTIAPGVVASTPPSTSSPSTDSTNTSSNSSGYQIDMNMRGLTASQQAIFRDAALHWQQIVVGDVPDTVYNGRVVDDLLIDVSAGYIDGAGGVLAGANADRFRTGSQLPYHGIIEFDSADLASMEANGTLRDVILHEIGHVLGIGTLWERRGLLVGAGTSTPGFVGPRAVAEYNALTGGNVTSVPVENSGGSGTREAHWSERIFASELMTGYVGPGVNLPLSRVTVASLADLGYQVNINAADSYRLA